MKQIIMICAAMLLLAGCNAADKASAPIKNDAQSQKVEDTPRFIGSYQENILERHANKVRNLQNATGTYDYFVQGNFYGDGRVVPVVPGGVFQGLQVKLEKGQKLLVQLGSWDDTGKKVITLSTRTAASGSDTKVKIPDGDGKLYFYRLAIKDMNGKIVENNYFPLYTPVKENNMIATASKQVYKKGETASIYYENWGMNELQTGSAYFIYKKGEDGWERVREDMAFTEKLIGVQPASIRVEHISLEGLDEGRYKLIKFFSREHGGESSGFELGVEFEIGSD